MYIKKDNIDNTPINNPCDISITINVRTTVANEYQYSFLIQYINDIKTIPAKKIEKKCIGKIIFTNETKINIKKINIGFENLLVLSVIILKMFLIFIR